MNTQPNACRCREPILDTTRATLLDTCRRCLKPLDSASRTPVSPRQAKRKHGTSPHRATRVERFEAAQRRKAEKRKRAKRSGR